MCKLIESSANQLPASKERLFRNEGVFVKEGHVSFSSEILLQILELNPNLACEDVVEMAQALFTKKDS